MANATSIRQRQHWVDIVRVIAIILVVVIHVAAPVMYDWGKVSFSYWMAANIYDSIARISVPLFFMISGYLLLGKEQTLGEFFSKRVARLAIPFIVWSIIYLFWRCQVNDANCSYKVLSRLISLEGTYFHLWFMYPLIGLYLITPLLRIIVSNSKNSMLWYFIGLWLVFQTGASLLLETTGLSMGITVPMATGYVGFYVLGHLLGQISISKRTAIVSIIVWILSTLSTMAGTYLLTVQDGEVNLYFYQYMNPTVVMASATAFILLRWLFDGNFHPSESTSRYLNSLATASFGIYLIHALMLDLIGRYNPIIHFKVEMGHPAWSIPLVSVVAFGASYVAVVILQKIPYLKRIVS